MPDAVEVEIAGRSLSIETGKLAAQAGGAVTVRYGDTMMLGTATASKPRPGIDFFPLSVEFEERLYAAGRIPGSFFRREGRPTTAAVLSARLTDRPIRPLFPKGYNDDTQLIITILSVDMENPPDTLGTIAASAALCVSDIPFEGPVASVRIGHVDGELVLQPTFAQLEASDLNLIVAGTKDAITMVEAEAGEVPETLLVEALALGQEAITQICLAQEELAEAVATPKRAYTPQEIDADALADAEAQIGAELADALSNSGDKTERDTRREQLKTGLLEPLDEGDRETYADAFDTLEKRIVRRNILEHGQRPDGRGTADLRQLSAEVDLIPRTHGSGLFQRGETQVLSITTLAGSGMAQRLDDLNPEDSKRFMHHYNFPPFSTGETGRVGNPSRRSIGHGMLGERAMQAILPPFEDFPYTIRVVSEVLASNGSTSMASICASVLSMMDAGVPLRTPIAGIAMGLIKEDDEVAILTDIVGMEDHLGDMDFKVAGSREGVTALQMDMKVKGIDLEILARALNQARDARLEIMDVMTSCIAEPREEMSPHAPRILRIDVPQDKIGQIIGPGGRNIRAMEEETGADISVEDDGAVFITATDAASGQAAYDRISALTREIEPGQIYTGKVVRILPFGAFVELVPGKDALVHISELAEHRVERVEDVTAVGEEMQVEVIEIDSLGRVNASRRRLLGLDDDAPRRSDDGPPRRQRRERGDRSDRGDRPDRDGGPSRRPPRQRRARPRNEVEPEEARTEAPPEPVAVEAAEAAEAAPEPATPELVPAAVSEPSPVVDGEDAPQPEGERSAAVAPPREGAPRRRRRRRRRGAAQADDSAPPSESGAPQAQQRQPQPRPEPEERQPESNDGGRRRANILSRVGIRRNEPPPSDGPPPPPPPPRSDFGAPSR